MTAGSGPTLGDIDLIVFGATMIDFVGKPAGGGLEGVDVFTRRMGGAPQNVATTASRLGRRTALITRVGNDAFGHYVRAELTRFQILDDWLQVDADEPTTLAFFP